MRAFSAIELVSVGRQKLPRNGIRDISLIDIDVNSFIIVTTHHWIAEREISSEFYNWIKKKKDLQR